MCYLHKGMVFNFQDLFFYFIVIIFVVGDIEKKNVFFPCLLFSYILEESRYKKGNTQKTFFIKRLHEEAMHLYMRPYTPLNAPLLDWISKCCFSLSVVISYDLAESRYQRKAKKPDFIKRQDQKVERAYI